MRSTLSAASCSLPACKSADEAEASLFDWEGIASRRTSPFEPVRLMFGSYPEPAARLTVRLNSDLKSDLLRSPPISSDLKSGDLKSEPVRLRFGEVRGIPFAIIIENEEREQGNVRVKDFAAGTQIKMSLEDLIKTLS
jgi:hypothetical protein